MRALALAVGCCLALTTPSAPTVAAAGSASAGQNLEDTPQARTVRAFMKAVAAGDLDGMRNTLSADGQEELDGLDPAETIEMMQAFLPEQGEITAVEIDGDTATVSIVERHDNVTSTATVRLVLENMEWKISP
jgi:hypothetical protein